MKWKEKGRRRERRNKKGNKEKQDRGVETMFIASALLTSSTCAYQCGLVVRAHLASSAAINLRFPTLDWIDIRWRGGGYNVIVGIEEGAFGNLV